MFRRYAFTLIELLIVISVVSILAAILYPVFAQAKRAAIQTSCLSRFGQVGAAAHMYLNDYDDTFMPVNHQPGIAPDPTTDRTWVQMMLPYTGSFQTFRCPADRTNIDQSLATFDQDLVPGDLFARYYEASMHVNLGYNFQYLSPIVKNNQAWSAMPKQLDTLPDPASMLLFIDSAWQIQDGAPIGGGNWLVSPPCRYQQVGNKVIDTIGTTVEERASPSRTQDETVYAPVSGWEPSTESGAQYGGAWPWHSGRLSIATIDGAARPITIAQLGLGCNVLPSWTGSIQDRHLYLWSPE